MGSTPLAGGTDVLRWPVIGPLLRWRHARTSLQLVLLLAALVVILHGLFGPAIGSANLATVLTWVHYRGLLVVALLAAGNVFCAGCPFIRVRDWGRRLHAPSRTWPSWLRGKWIAIVLFAAVLFAYEWLDLWALPRGTAYLLLGYFGAALAIDLVFTGAAFCKHLCPIGQYSFVASTMSPLELRIRDRETCAGCRTADCIAGRQVERPFPETLATGPAPRSGQRGCELGLFLPRKIGNLDCTFCLDCVQACPHDNIALAGRVPGLELANASRRSGIGRLTDRPDLALLVLLFVFGALMNAVAMTAPAHAVQGWLAHVIGTRSEPVVLGGLFLLGLGVAPLTIVGGASAVTRLSVRDSRARVPQLAMRYAFGLIPFGFGVWLAHYGFHLLTGLLVVVPVTQSAAMDLVGIPLFGQPLWHLAGMRPGAVLPIELGVVLLGTLGSLGVTHLISVRDYPTRAARATAPWAVAIVVLAAAAVWMLFQPMEMRGTGLR
jgi:hypothetical protein